MSLVNDSAVVGHSTQECRPRCHVRSCRGGLHGSIRDCSKTTLPPPNQSALSLPSSRISLRTRHSATRLVLLLLRGRAPPVTCTCNRCSISRIVILQLAVSGSRQDAASSTLSTAPLSPIRHFFRALATHTSQATSVATRYFPRRLLRLEAAVRTCPVRVFAFLAANLAATSFLCFSMYSAISAGTNRLSAAIVGCSAGSQKWPAIPATMASVHAKFAAGQGYYGRCTRPPSPL